jgi:hypothetical protein
VVRCADVLRRGHADAPEFPHPDADFGNAAVVPELQNRQLLLRHGRHGEPRLHCTRINDRCYSNAELAGALRKTDRVVCSMPLGTPLVEALAQLDRFAKEVMPAFRGAKVAAAAE